MFYNHWYRKYTVNKKILDKMKYYFIFENYIEK